MTKRFKNIYLKAHYNGFNFIHKIFKYRILVPGVNIVHYLMRKHIVKVPNKWYNRNFKIFEKAYNKSEKEWSLMFLNSIPWRKKIPYRIRISMWSCRVLRKIKDLIIMMCLSDTSYREFFNILMHNIADEMHKEYHGTMVNHLFYTNESSYGVTYFALGDMLSKNKVELKVMRSKRHEETK